MECYNCGCSLSEKDFCTNCGIDVGLYKKIMFASNMYYNDGLQKANIRDLSGAVLSLKQSLKFNKNNIEARNLLGLVYYEMGEAVAALGEWVISKNLKSQKNIADDYIRMVQSNPSKLEAINQTIKKYNQALVYCQQNSLDLAVIQLKKVLSINPNFVKGYQLLGLLYLNNDELERAKKTLNKVLQIDTNNTLTLTYLKEIEDIRKSREEAQGKKKKASKKEEIITYQSGNETIIQPVNNRESGGLATVVNLAIGILVGILISIFLILPTKVQSEKRDMNTNLKNVSEQLEAKNLSVAELEQRLEALTQEKSTLQQEVDTFTGSDGAMKATDYLLAAAMAYMDNSDDVTKIMDALSAIDQDYLDSMASETFKDVYDSIYGDVSVKAAEEYKEAGMKAYRDKDYAAAITELTRAFELNDQDGEVLLNLGNAFRQSENKTKAEEIYHQVIELFPDTSYSRNAESYLSESENSASQPPPEEDTEQNSSVPGNQTPAPQPQLPDPGAVDPNLLPPMIDPDLLDPNLVDPGLTQEVPPPAE